MPNSPDKIIINHGGLRSFQQIIDGYMDAIATTLVGEGGRGGALMLGKEIEQGGWALLAEAKQFLAEQEKSCDEIDAAASIFVEALQAYHAAQIERNNRIRLWIDTKLAQRTP